MKNPWPLSEEELAAKFAALRLAGQSVEWANEDLEDHLQKVVCDYINSLLPMFIKQAGRRAVRVNYQPPLITITGVFYVTLDGGVNRKELVESQSFHPDPETGFDWGGIVGFINRERARLEKVQPTQKKRRAVL